MKAKSEKHISKKSRSTGKAKSNSLKLKSFEFLVVVFSFSFLVFRFAAAQEPHEIGTIGEGEGFGPWANIPDLSTATGYFTKILSNIIGVMTIAAGIWFIFQFIIGAYGWLTAGGEKAGVQAAQSRITNAFIGLTVVVAAYAIIWIIGKLLGFEILHPERLIELVGPG